MTAQHESKKETDPSQGLAFTEPEDGMQTSKKKSNEKPYPAMMPLNHKNDQMGKIFVKV